MIVCAQKVKLKNRRVYLMRDEMGVYHVAFTILVPSAPKGHRIKRTRVQLSGEAMGALVAMYHADMQTEQPNAQMTSAMN